MVGCDRRERASLTLSRTRFTVARGRRHPTPGHDSQRRTRRRGNRRQRSGRSGSSGECAVPSRRTDDRIVAVSRRLPCRCPRRAENRRRVVTWSSSPACQPEGHCRHECLHGRTFRRRSSSSCTGRSTAMPARRSSEHHARGARTAIRSSSISATPRTGRPRGWRRSSPAQISACGYPRAPDRPPIRESSDYRHFACERASWGRGAPGAHRGGRRRHPHDVAARPRGRGLHGRRRPRAARSR